MGVSLTGWRLFGGGASALFRVMGAMLSKGPRSGYVAISYSPQDEETSR